MTNRPIARLFEDLKHADQQSGLTPLDLINQIKRSPIPEAGKQQMLDEINRLAEEVLTREEVTAAIAAINEETHQKAIDILKISAHEHEKDTLILSLFNHPEFQQLIEEGHITFAMIKPEANLAKKDNEKYTDDEIAQQVKSEIKAPLQILFSKVFAMSAEDAREFYAHLADRPGLLESYSKWMASGGITALVLADLNGNAIAEWRKQMGPTNPQKPDDEGRKDRIRHRYADAIDNNVTHGSDSIESVKRELKWFEKKMNESFSAYSED